MKPVKDRRLVDLRRTPMTELLERLEAIAMEDFDGHWTIFSFTSGFKIAFGTPTIYPGSDGVAYAQLAHMPTHITLKDAIIAAIHEPKNFVAYFDGDAQVWWKDQFNHTHLTRV